MLDSQSDQVKPFTGELCHPIDGVADDRLYAMWHLFTHTAMRRGEVCGVSWADVDLDAGRLEVRTELVQLGYEAAEDWPKTEASDAPVSLDKASVTLLRAWRKQQAAEQLAAGKPGRGVAACSHARTGRPTIRSGLPNGSSGCRSPPGFRPSGCMTHGTHGAACLAHASGASTKAIQALLRHASYTITADTYTTVFNELGEALAEDIASVVPRQRPVADSSETAGLTTV